MLMRGGRNKRRVMWKRRREGQGSEERAKLVRTGSSQNRIVQRNSDTMSITRSVDIGVIAIMRDELVKISKGNANEKVKGSIHNKEIKRKVKGDSIVIRVKSRHFNTKVANNLSNDFNAVVSHVEAIARREMLG